MKFFLNFLNCIKMIMRLKKLFYNFVKILLVCTACTHSFPFAPLNAWINFWTVTHFQIQTRLILAPKNPIWFSYKYQKGEKMLFGNLHRSLNNEYYEIIFEWMNKLKRGSYWRVCVFMYWVFWKQWKYWVTKLKENWYCALTYKRCVNVSST